MRAFIMGGMIMVTLDKFKKAMEINGDIDDGLLAEILDEARGVILAYTNREESEWKPVFNCFQSMIARSLYNRLGAEGLRSRAEGAVSGVFNEMSADLLAILKMYRAARPL